MPWAAVIGSPISHSLSPVLHRAAWDSLGLGEDWEYLRLEQTSDTLPTLLASLDEDCVGLSVTMPCKQAVMPLLDVIDPLAEAVGSTNTVVPSAQVLTGFNTDVHGILRAVTEARGAAGLGRARSAVVLGARATASSAVAALGSLHTDHVTVVARHFAGPGTVATAATRLGIEVEMVPWARTDAVREVIERADVLVSTVPAGAADDLARTLAPRPDQVLLDVVYSPLETPLVRTWRDHGAPVAHGLEMLLHQAVLQVRLMTGRDPDIAWMRRAMLAAVTGQG
ncbi:shikimate dehydrogenase [Actinomyces polynesiensis]|uniref:shikimate dehydrogenase n=1 Tax=Actinomyces polynesiensis TaxID=1325934 RepID=UPI0005B822DB|nr:shikimate dehydrogenase [Actinomyces polynesiensis]